MQPIFYGAQAAPAYVPAVGTFFPTGGMNLVQKAANLVATAGSQMMIRAVYYNPSMWVQKIAQKYGVAFRWVLVTG
jgi:hypothetical protein